MKLDYVLMDPTGNRTVLVKTPVPAERQPDCARALLIKEPTAEQVGFLSADADGADVALRMAGGEFCGNAAMSAAALRCAELGRKSASLRVRVSGAGEPIRVEVTARADGAWDCAEAMPRPTLPELVSLVLDGETYRLPLLHFDGITHLILPGDADRALAERAAPRWCAALHADALGLMLLDAPAGRLTPLVYVPGGDTLYWERSCASGSAAAGAYLAWVRGGPAEAVLTQPGGVLRVFAGAVGEITLCGSVKRLHVGEIHVK